MPETASPPKPKKPRAVGLRMVEPKEVDLLEAQHQERVFGLVEFWRSRFPDLAALFAVPNGGYRHKATAAALQRQGVRAGVPDMFLPAPRALFHGLWIELKRLKLGEVSEAQAGWLNYLEGQGYRAIVCWGWRAAWEELCEYLGADEALGHVPNCHISRHKDGYLERKEIKRK